METGEWLPTLGDCDGEQNVVRIMSLLPSVVFIQLADVHQFQLLTMPKHLLSLLLEIQSLNTTVQMDTTLILSPICARHLVTEIGGAQSHLAVKVNNSYENVQMHHKIFLFNSCPLSLAKYTATHQVVHQWGSSIWHYCHSIMWYWLLLFTWNLWSRFVLQRKWIMGTASTILQRLVDLPALLIMYPSDPKMLTVVLPQNYPM